MKIEASMIALPIFGNVKTQTLIAIIVEHAVVNADPDRSVIEEFVLVDVLLDLETAIMTDPARQQPLMMS